MIPELSELDGEPIAEGTATGRRLVWCTSTHGASKRPQNGKRMKVEVGSETREEDGAYSARETRTPVVED